MTDVLEQQDAQEARSKRVMTQARPDQVARTCAAVPDLLEKACAYSGGRFTPESVRQACEAGKWQLWLAFDYEAAKKDPGNFGKHVDVVTVTSLSQYPTGLKIAEILLIAGRGKSEEWLHNIDNLKDWAAAEDCDRLQFIGRQGWRRMLGDSCKMVMTMFEIGVKEDDDGRKQRRH